MNIYSFIAAVLLATAAGINTSFLTGTLVFFGVLLVIYAIFSMFIATRNNMVRMHSQTIQAIKARKQ